MFDWRKADQELPFARAAGSDQTFPNPPFIRKLNGS
jgi:hypothetical protein